MVDIEHRVSHFILLWVNKRPEVKPSTPFYTPHRFTLHTVLHSTPLKVQGPVRGQGGGGDCPIMELVREVEA